MQYLLCPSQLWSPRSVTTFSDPTPGRQRRNASKTGLLAKSAFGCCIQASMITDVAPSIRLFGIYYCVLRLLAIGSKRAIAPGGNDLMPIIAGGCGTPIKVSAAGCQGSDYNLPGALEPAPPAYYLSGMTI